MKSTKQLMEEASHIQLPVLKSMEYLIDKSRDNGYESDFIIQDGAMLCNQSKRKFCPEEVHIVNFYRFEGISDPEDNSILYIIETTDGTKGTLADAYGVYSSPEVDEFIKLVTDIHKKVDK